MIVQLTNAGAAAIEGGTGPVVVTTFKLGSAFGYVPQPTDTDIHGTEVFAGAPSLPIAVSANLVKYSIYLDYPLGPIDFGEFGIYMSNGELFALGTGSELVHKLPTTSSSVGNSIRLDIFLSFVGTNYEMFLEFAESNNEFRMAVIQSPDVLPQSAQAVPNAYIIPGVTASQSAFLAYTDRNGLWNFDAYAFANSHTGTITGSSSQSVTIDISEFNADMAPEYLGQLILEFTSGPLYSVCRYIKTAVPFGGSVTLGFDNPMALLPNVGDTFVVFSRQANSNSNVLLPIASATLLGGIKVGDTLTIDPITGVLNINGTSGSVVTSVNGQTGAVVLHANEIEDIAAVAVSNDYNDLSNLPTPYSLPQMSTSVRGGAMLPSDGSLIVVSGALQLGINPVQTVDGQSPDASGNLNLTINGLANPAAIPVDDDLNAYRTNGQFFGPDSNVITNSPTTAAFTLEVSPQTANNTGAVIQRVMTGDDMFWRRFDGSAWGTWQVVATPGSSIPIATYTTLGGIIAGPSLSVQPDGTLDVNDSVKPGHVDYCGTWDPTGDQDAAIVPYFVTDFDPQRLATGGQLEWFDDVNSVWNPVDGTGRIYQAIANGTSTIDGLGTIVTNDLIISVNDKWQKINGVPIASSTVVGGVKVASSSGLDLAGDGSLSVALPEAVEISRSGKDSNGVFTTITYTRPDATVYQTSILSGGTSPQYTTRTVTWYAADGTTVVRTDVYTLAYDSDGDITSETLP